MKKRLPKVGIIILNYNGKELLKNCLNSLLRNTVYNNYHIVVVDNASTDESVENGKKIFQKQG